MSINDHNNNIKEDGHMQQDKDMNINVDAQNDAQNKDVMVDGDGNINKVDKEDKSVDKIIDEENKDKVLNKMDGNKIDENKMGGGYQCVENNERNVDGNTKKNAKNTNVKKNKPKKIKSNQILNSKVGLIAKKIGMTSIFNEDGALIPVTLLHVVDNVVLKIQKYDDFDVVTVCTGKMKNPTKPIVGMAKKANIESFAKAKSFKVKSNSKFMIGDVFTVKYFKIGQLIDAQSKTIGKGFAGVMKRYNFAGLEASHGVSLTHRSHGSTGQRQDPGKVFKGKKMAGHMGDKNRTIQNLRIIDIDDVNNIIAVSGAVPGAKNSCIIMRSACKIL